MNASPTLRPRAPRAAAVLAAAIWAWTPEARSLEIASLRCEYDARPLGIDAPAPRLSWTLSSDLPGDRPTAFHVLVASSPARLSRDIGDLWDSGRIESDRQLFVPYAGAALKSGQRVWWKVRAWDAQGRPGPWSETGEWEMGLLAPEDWLSARWIGLDPAADTRSPEHRGRARQTDRMPQPDRVDSFPSPRLRREFALTGRVARARLYLCGLGYAEAYLNGQRVGDDVLDPAQTTYDVRAFYRTYDVTSYLRSGPNAIGLWLGNGFFGQNIAFAANLSYGPPRAIARLAIELDNGRRVDVGTDTNWQAAVSAVLFDNVYAGETFDARLDDLAWTLPGGGRDWPAALEMPAPTARLQPQTIPGMRRIRRVPPVRIWPSGEGRWLVDFGQNLAGWVRVTADEPVGTVITLRFSELLNAAGDGLDTASTGVFATGVEQTDVLICRDGETRWEPRFTYHGFRYCEVSGLSSPPTEATIEAWLVRTAVADAGAWSSSDDVLNRFQSVSRWTLESNLHGTAEDCPHRERCGWLGDAHTVGEMALFNLDMAAFWAKFVDDIETVLGRGGIAYTGRKARPGIPCNIAVGRRLCQEARPDWGAAYVLLPWYLLVYGGNLEPARRHYEHMVRWVDHVAAFSSNGIVVEGYGDWCPPGGNEAMDCPVPLTSTAFQYFSLNCLAQLANRLERPAEAAGLARRAAAIRTAFLQAFYDPARNDFGSQTANAVALRFGLYPDGHGRQVAASLARHIKAVDGHRRTGIHGARWLYTGLADHGFDTIALASLAMSGYPGHADLLERGCTTWPEVELPPEMDDRWRRRSHSHPMQAGFAAFFFESLAGIRPDPAAPGFGRLRMRPAGFRSLEFVDAEHRSPRGPIRSRWTSKGGRFAWDIALPPGSAAEVWIPASDPAAVTAAVFDGTPANLPGTWADGWYRAEIRSGRWRITSRLPAER